MVERQEERSPSDDPSSLPLGSQQEKLEDNRSLLEEVMFTKILQIHITAVDDCLKKIKMKQLTHYNF